MSKRGRLSSADRERIHALSERGLSAAQIAKEVERREDVIEGILNAGKKNSTRGRKPRAYEPPPRAQAAFPPRAPRAERPRGVLEHQLWIRPGYHIELVLPADLTGAEAERLANWARSLPFA
ncbi:MAG: hypothetical protein KIS61_17945 [Candidatus Eremiobacteraeota bacterium]|nr:hypothetical protein [Candidatus Eremiobacteraeota bacterium]